MKLYYDTGNENKYSRGDLVWLYSPQRKKGISPKLMRPWKGPFTVTKRLNDLVYRIQLGPWTKPKVVHHNRLWKYRGKDPKIDRLLYTPSFHTMYWNGRLKYSSLHRQLLEGDVT